MKKFKDQCAQGDMLITRVESMPHNVERCKPEDNGDHIVTHSETGHHHVVDSATVNFFQAANDDLVSFLEVVKPTPIRHLREAHTHEEIMLDPGIYRVNRQREWTPERLRMVMD